MSKDSSENNVQDRVLSETSYTEEEQRTVVDVISHCQIIYDAIINLDKKCDIIDGKVSKIQRRHAKGFWHYRKPFGFTGKNYSYLISRKIKAQKMKKKELNNSFSYPESYSPTCPVRRQENDSESNFIIPSFNSDEELQEIEPESPFRGPDIPYGEGPSIPYAEDSCHNTYFTSHGTVATTSMAACFGISQPLSPNNISSVTKEPAAFLVHREPTPVYNPDQRGFPVLMENNNNVPSLCISSGFATSSPIHHVFSVLKQQGPLTWCVEDVLLFLKHIDPPLADILTEIFRQHDIDGKALLLLTSEVMMKYLGLKLGTTLKLCHYIEKLKEEVAFKN